MDDVKEALDALQVFIDIFAEGARQGRTVDIEAKPNVSEEIVKEFETIREALTRMPPAVDVEWEFFCDHSYYDKWAVRPKGETRWGHCFHLNSKDEAQGLCELLTQQDHSGAWQKIQSLKARKELLTDKPFGDEELAQLGAYCYDIFNAIDRSPKPPTQESE